MKTRIQTLSNWTVMAIAFGILGAVRVQGGALSATYEVLAAASTVNLTADGQLDWAHWGRTNTNDFNHKAGGVSQISNFTLIGEEPVQQFGDNFTGYSWTNGTPTARATKSTSGIYVIGEGNGFKFTVPADPTVKTLKVYVGVYAAQMRFEASLSDNSAPPYTDESFENVLDGPNRIYVINFAADSPSQTLTLQLVVARYINEWANVTLQAAVLREGAPLIEVAQPLSGAIFYPAANGVQFQVSTLSPNSLPTNQIQLILNDRDVSADLNIAGTATRRTVTYGKLEPNLFYRGQVLVKDALGMGTTNLILFDTFSTNGSVVIEAEDYNYGDGAGETQTPSTVGGWFQDYPQPSGYDANQSVVGGLQPDGKRIGYFETVGLPEVDYSDTGTGTGLYRTMDPVNTQGTSDTPRPHYQSVGVGDYHVTDWVNGEWLNYTRTFPAGYYYAYLRYASLDDQTIQFDRVTSDPGKPSQILQTLGTFNATRTGNENSYRYVPLTDALGKMIPLNLSGKQTLRLTGANVTSGFNGLRANFLLLAPAGDVTVRLPYIDSAVPAPDSEDAPPDVTLSIVIRNADTAVDSGSIQLRLEGTDVTAQAMVTDTPSGATVVYDPATMFSLGAQYTVSLVYSDKAPLPNRQTNSWIFTVANLPVIPARYATPPSSGRTNGFRIKMNKAPNDSDPAFFTNSAARAEQQVANQLIDPNTGLPFLNEAAGPNGDGSFTEPAVINYEQDATEVGYFAGDTAFPGVEPFSPDFMAMEVTAYLELTAGVHRFGVRSDDGFQLAAGMAFTNANTVLGFYEGSRGSGLPDGATEFEFVVESAGVYAFRLIWYEGNGGADLEWFSVDRATLGSTNVVRTLINDAGSSKAIKAFQGRAGSPANKPKAPVLQNPRISGGLLSFAFLAETGFRYTVEVKDNLADATWQKPLAPIVGDGAVKVVTLPASKPAQFVRVAAE